MDPTEPPLTPGERIRGQGRGTGKYYTGIYIGDSTTLFVVLREDNGERDKIVMRASVERITELIIDLE